MLFAIPMRWREPKDHLNDCYFCRVDINVFSIRDWHLLVYPSLDSAVRPVPLDVTLPVPVAPEDALTSDNSEVESCSEDACGLDASFMCQDNYAPHFLSQEDLNDLMRDLTLSKEKAELLASRLQQNNLLEKNVCVTYFRKRRRDLASFFTVQGPLCYCHDKHEQFQA